MSPIHDTDVAKERWTQAEWGQYELWEKVESRMKHRKRLWTIATIGLFFILSSVPIVVDQWPKWMTRSMMRQLAQEINHVKMDASLNRTAFRIRFLEKNKLNFVVEQLDECSAATAKMVRMGSFVKKMSNPEQYVWISSEEGVHFKIPGLLSQFCYDPLQGNAFQEKSGSLMGFGIIPAKDLTIDRFDRASILLVMGPEAELSFE